LTVSGLHYLGTHFTNLKKCLVVFTTHVRTMHPLQKDLHLNLTLTKTIQLMTPTNAYQESSQESSLLFTSPIAAADISASGSPLWYPLPPDHRHSWPASSRCQRAQYPLAHHPLAISTPNLYQPATGSGACCKETRYTSAQHKHSYLHHIIDLFYC
jgi:hypothetical protein